MFILFGVEVIAIAVTLFLVRLSRCLRSRRYGFSALFVDFRVKTQKKAPFFKKIFKTVCERLDISLKLY